jgi:uncharacterized protein YceK
MKFRFTCLLVLLGCLLGGCTSITSRIKEKSAAFAALDAPTQEKLRKGTVEPGYTLDMVYIALGAPDERTEMTTTHGHRVIWIYTTTHQEYMGSGQVGYRRVFVRNPSTGATYVYLEPVYTDVYRDRIEEHIRIIFQDGKVDAIEQTKQ